jgi:hypothetical protein
LHKSATRPRRQLDSTAARAQCIDRKRRRKHQIMMCCTVRRVEMRNKDHNAPKYAAAAVSVGHKFSRSKTTRLAWGRGMSRPDKTQSKLNKGSLMVYMGSGMPGRYSRHSTRFLLMVIVESKAVSEISRPKLHLCQCQIVEGKIA